MYCTLIKFISFLFRNFRNLTFNLTLLCLVQNYLLCLPSYAQSSNQSSEVEVSNFGIQNLPFCDISLKQLIQVVEKIRRDNASNGNLEIEPFYNSLNFLYNKQKNEFKSGKSRLNPDQASYCLINRTLSYGEVEIPLLPVEIIYVYRYKYPYSSESYYYRRYYYKYSSTSARGSLGLSTKMVVSAEEDRAVIKEIAGIKTNIELFFNPPDLKVTKSNIIELIQGVLDYDFVFVPYNIGHYDIYSIEWLLNFSNYRFTVFPYIYCERGFFPNHLPPSLPSNYEEYAPTYEEYDNVDNSPTLVEIQTVYRLGTSNDFGVHIRPRYWVYWHATPYRKSNLRSYVCPSF